jgi:hypothetical protein
MSRQITLRIRTAQRAAIGCLAILVMACGGGGGSGGGDSSSASSEGPISGFGSVIMNGVRWNTDSAKFDVDGLVGSQDDLDVGMVVRIEGHRRSDGRATADRVICIVSSYFSISSASSMVRTTVPLRHPVST